jgi:adenosylmethionine-8-amino-7-oxononanoate aminotransferase
MRKHGVILRPLGDTVVVMPPLSVDESEIDAIVDALSACLGEVLGA